MAQSSSTARKPRTLPPLPPVRRRIHLNTGPLIVAAVLFVLLGYPAWLIGSSIYGSALLKEGNAARDAGDFATAQERFTAAMHWSRDNEEPFRRRLEIANITGNFDAALVDFSAYVQDNPNSFFGYCYRAVAYRELGNLTQARRDYQACLDHNPDSTWTRLATIAIENIDS